MKQIELAKNNDNPLAQKFHAGFLIRFTLPTIVMMIFMGLYTISDTIMVSRYVNTDALSSINIVCPVINVFVGLGTMVATGGSAIIARNLGEGKEKESCQLLSLFMITGIAIGIALSIFGLLWSDTIIRWLGASETLFPYCNDYLTVLLLFIPASMLQLLFQSLIVTAGRPVFGMICAVGAGILNIMLDYYFMTLLSMGIAGSAWGTGISYLVPAVICLYFFFTTKGSLKFKKPMWNPIVVLQGCFNGSSEMVSQLAAAVSTFMFNSIMLHMLNEDGVAAINILIYFQFMLTALYIGFSMGVAPIFSYQYGKGNALELKRLFRLCLRFIITVSLAVFVIAMLFSSTLIGLFAERGSVVYHIAIQGFLIFSFGFLFSGCNIFSSALFTALSNGLVSATISFLRTFGFLCSALLFLPKLIGLQGVWLAVPIAEFCTLLIACLLIWKYRKIYHYL